MGLYNFKDKYYNYSGEEIASASNVKFLSPIGVGSAMSRIAPSNSSMYIGLTADSTTFCILANGLNKINIGSGGINGPKLFIVGSGINNTIIEGKIALGIQTNANVYLNDTTVKNLFLTETWAGNKIVWSFRNCDIASQPVLTATSSLVFRNCIIRVNAYTGINNSYVGVDGKTIPSANLNLFDNCNVVLTASDISTYKNNYLAFNNCKLRIGSEPDYTPLSGTTEVELRANFVTRCMAQSITVSDITDMGETLKQGKWVFSNNSCIDGLVLKDSVIHNFEKRRLIYFGYSDSRLDKIAITTDKSHPSSFSQAYANSSVVVTNDSIALASDADISKSVKGESDTNIICLGGKYQLNKLDIIQNFPKSYGVFVDSSPSLSSTPVNKNGGIIPYENGVQRTYLVRSNDDLEATIAYNGVNYSSAISARNNIFRGVSNVTSFTTVTANAVVYEILDEVMHQTIQMRIVNKIPNGDIAAGTALTDGYWYLVEHDSSQSNTTDYVTYGGTNYPVGSSFIAIGEATFTKSGNVYLRRCWHKDFDWSTMNPTDTDYNFWQNEQKPIWFDVLPDDLRCLMKYNNGMEIEMQTDIDGNYIASGHADFYNSILGVTGIVKPSYSTKLPHA